MALRLKSAKPWAGQTTLAWHKRMVWHAEPAGYIESNGGRVLAAVCLTGKPHSSKLALSPTRLDELRKNMDQNLNTGGWEGALAEPLGLERAALANPDLPVSFVAESLMSLVEPREDSMPFVPRG